MYLISDIKKEIADRGRKITNQAIHMFKERKLKEGVHFIRGFPTRFTKRGRTAVLKHFKVYRKKN
ncbi:hypothetical protein D9V86_09850 [Bacteroidetes/Chlorobi group bacterium ChocPot_Mid]|nr:MAG: hypothetical protein D9V86_09850 [Bacteroidetes/Chlorobi group bacterium ChocPot_Mid]